MINQEMQRNVNQESRITEVLNQLSYNQIRFIVARLDSETDKEAALKIGIDPATVSRWPERELIREAITLMALQAADGAIAIIKRNTVKAAMVKVKGLDSDDPRVAQQASREILDRTLGEPEKPINVRDDVTDDQRIARLATILDAARARRSGQPDSGNSV